MHAELVSSSSRGDLALRISRYGAAACGGIAGAFCGFESAQAALVVTPSTINLTDDPGVPPVAMVDLDGDNTPEVGVLIFSASLLSAQGVGSASLAGNIGTGGFFYPTAFQPGSTVGPSLFFSANSLGAPHSFGTLANSLGGPGGPGVGDWLGGGGGYLGAKFTIGGQEHYGWVHVMWDPGSDALTIDQVAYDNTPNASAMVTPEPTSLTLLALGAIGLCRRRRQC